MKKLLSAVLLVACALSMVITLVSCGGRLSGTYEGALCDLKFNGSKVTVIVGENELNGKYEIKEKNDRMTISFDFVDEDTATDEELAVLKVIDKLLGTELNFEEDGDEIKIGYMFSFKKK